jgi:hypothetical protein
MRHVHVWPRGTDSFLGEQSTVTVHQQLPTNGGGVGPDGTRDDVVSRVR